MVVSGKEAEEEFPVPQAFGSQDYAVAFGKFTVDELRRWLASEFPAGVPANFTRKRYVKYFQLDFGNPDNAKKSYKDVYR